ncbi:uncharacterized protein LOC132925895 [Rhopalosiphum padi]|uniref:uncharacterized protein LOC132925895 n=1 Tax=Rhopalosiphum padi TaxID=40932 RepID=UPI00298DF73C|nr:uncharacterized protein LOC132925895 [Rhopalosiphum padi]
MRSTRKWESDKTGKGFVNFLINSLPFEAHVPKYQYCGPGTKLKKRLDRGDKGINPLDTACRDHDIVYETSKNLEDRHNADKVLELRAWERFKAKDTPRKEKIVAYAVANTMKAKRKIGMGCKGKRGRVNKIKNGTRAAIKKKKVKKNYRGKRLILAPGQTGGAIPLIPIFAGLSALGSLMSGSASVYNAIQNSKRNKGNGLKNKGSRKKN